MMAITFLNIFPHSSCPSILTNQLTSGPPSSSKALICCSLSCQCFEGAVTPPKGQQWSQATLEVAAEAWKQAESQDSLLSCLVCFPKMTWLTQTSFLHFLLLKSSCGPLMWSAQGSRHNQTVRGMRDCIIESFMPWPGVCIPSAHHGGRGMVLISQGGGFTDSLALASLSVMPSPEGWPLRAVSSEPSFDEEGLSQQRNTARGVTTPVRGKKKKKYLYQESTRDLLFFPPGIAAT